MVTSCAKHFTCTILSKRETKSYFILRLQSPHTSRRTRPNPEKQPPCKASSIWDKKSPQIPRAPMQAAQKRGRSIAGQDFKLCPNLKVRPSTQHPAIPLAPWAS